MIGSAKKLAIVLIAITICRPGAVAAGELDRKALFDVASDPAALSAEQKLRVETLITEGKFDNALIEAKSYYNVAPLVATKPAIRLVYLALSKTRAKDDKAVLNSYLLQQEEGARALVVADFKAGSQENVLNTIKIDPAPYLAAIEKTKSEDSYVNLMTRGNLLLLVGRASEARQAFLAACQLPDTKDKSLFAAVEGVARSLRAEDGISGPANSLVISLALGNEAAAQQAGFPIARWKNGELQVAGQRILLPQLSIPAQDDFDQKMNETDKGALHELEAISLDLSEPLTVASLGPPVDTQLVAWLEKWQWSPDRTATISTQARTNLALALRQTNAPSILLFHLGHVFMMRSKDAATSALFYEAAAHRMDEELPKLGQSLQSVAILRAAKDHMDDFKHVLWPLIESEDQDALDGLYTIYTNYTKWAPPSDGSIRKPLVHVQIGAAECLHIRHDYVGAESLLKSLDPVKMDKGERLAFEWAYALTLDSLNRYAECAMHLRAVVGSSNPHTTEAQLRLAEVLAVLGDKTGSQDAFNEWIKQCRPPETTVKVALDAISRRVQSANK